jgi:hypothetical protein
MIVRQSMIRPISRCLLPTTSPPLHSWSWRMKSPTKVASVAFPVLLRQLDIAIRSGIMTVRRASLSSFARCFYDTKASFGLAIELSFWSRLQEGSAPVLTYGRCGLGACFQSITMSSASLRVHISSISSHHLVSTSKLSQC